MNKDNEFIKLYSEFRKELDKICIPEILGCVETIKIRNVTGEAVGIMCVAYTAGWKYIDCLYILPGYRRMGIAKAAVLDFFKENKYWEIRLHILNKNRPAKKFWNSIFDLERMEENGIDTLYMIKGLK